MAGCLARWIATLLCCGLAAGCGTPQHEIRPPARVANITSENQPAEPPPPPPLPADRKAYDSDFVYCWYPSTLGIVEVFTDPGSYGHVISFGPLPPQPAPSESPAPTLPVPGAETPATPATPATPTTPATPEAPTSPPPPPPPPKPTTTTARLVVLPGFPGDGFDRNINGAAGLRASMGTLYSQLFGQAAFSDIRATPIAPTPGVSQAWTIDAADDRGRNYGFIVRSSNFAAWAFCRCETAPDSQATRDALLDQLRLRLGSAQRFDDLMTEYRLETDLPAHWKIPGPSLTSRRWDAPDQLGFLVIDNGEPRGGSVFRACSAEDARQALQAFPPVAAALKQTKLEIHATDRFQPALWAATGAAETTLDTLPHATTVGAWVFYDPVARKKFSVYYGYQSAERKREIDRMLAHLSRSPLVP